MITKHVVKSSGNSQVYSREKHYRSIQKTLFSVGLSKHDVQQISESVESATEEWLANKHEVTSLDIRVFTLNQLQMHHPEAALVYKKYGQIW